MCTGCFRRDGHRLLAPGQSFGESLELTQRVGDPLPPAPVIRLSRECAAVVAECLFETTCRGERLGTCSESPWVGGADHSYPRLCSRAYVPRFL